MSSTLWVVVWWLAFGGTHLLLSSTGVKNALTGIAGRAGFMLIYSAVAFATFIPLIRTYFGGAKHQGQWLWQLYGTPGAASLTLLLSALGWVLIVASVVRPSPVGMMPVEPEARGLIRVTRHPMLVGVIVWALGHMLINASTADLAFFGGFVVYGVLGALHQDSRKRALPEMAGFYASTSFIPFAAIASGRNRLVLGEMPWLTLLLGVLVAGGIFAAHGWLGGSVTLAGQGG